MAEISCKKDAEVLQTRRSVPSIMEREVVSALSFVNSLPTCLRRGFKPALSTYSASRRVYSARRAVRASAAEPPVQSLEDLRSSVDATVEDALSKISAAEDESELEKLRVEFLGKKGRITVVTKVIGKLPPHDRPAVGAIINAAKEKVTEAVASRKEEIEDMLEEAREEEEWIDVTLPGIRHRPRMGRIHPITSTIDLAVETFVDLGYDLIDDMEYNKEIETDYYCFEALNCPKDHPAREMQDTFYLNEDKTELLRTQTSAVQIRYMEKHKPPLYIIAPGRVYRRDSVDATHTAMFHQIEILALDKAPKLTLGSLKATVEHFLKKMLGEDIKTRFRGSYFPFTEPSMEVDVFFRGKWLEMLGCGMVDPQVLINCNIDPDEYQGFAAGFGVERFAMVMHEITDIRELYNSNLNFLTQFMY